MLETTFVKAGDVVQLKSGGPRMTVGSVEDNKATVFYYLKDENGDWNAEPEEVLFPLCTLTSNEHDFDEDYGD